MPHGTAPPKKSLRLCTTQWKLKLDLQVPLAIKKKFLFLCGCAGWPVLHGLFQFRQSGTALQQQHTASPLWQFLLLQNTGSRVLRLQGWRLPGSGAQAQQLWRTGLAALQPVGSSWTGDCTRVSCTGGFFTTRPPGKPLPLTI